MLNKSEKFIMDVIYDKCGCDGSCLISLSQIKTALHKTKISDNKIKSTIKSLELDDYYELIVCERDNEELYCINLHTKGYGFKREKEQFKRAILNRAILATVTAVITYLVGRILIYIFK